jgi:hypothetical protein
MGVSRIGNAGQVKNPVVCAQNIGYDSTGKVWELDAIRFRLMRFSGIARSGVEIQ